MGSFGSLVDILAVVIGFAAVMLLLSLIVTAMVQITQNVLRMRSENLRDGIEFAIERAMKTKAVTSTIQDAKGVANQVMEEISLPPPRSWVGKLANSVLPRARTWLKSEELDEYLAEMVDRGVGGLRTEHIEPIRKQFQRLEPLMTVRFGGYIRLVTVTWALVVAFYFQVSSIDLLQKLVQDPAYRAAAVAVGEQLAEGQGGEIRDNIEAPEQMARRAALVLAEAHEEHAEQIRTAAESGGEEEITAALEEQLADLPPEQRSELIAEYQETLDALYLASVRESMTQVSEARVSLTALALSPWQYGWAFYCSAANWLGLLITIIALSLGAPFWFNVLKSAVGLRDTLKPKGAEQS